MARSRGKRLPRFRSLDQLVGFFDAKDLGEYWESLPEAHFDVAIRKRTHLVAIDPRLASKLGEIARGRRVSSERLLNSWLREKLHEQAGTPK